MAAAVRIVGGDRAPTRAASVGGYCPHGLSCSGMRRRRSSAQPTDACRRRSPGRRPTSLTAGVASPAVPDHDARGRDLGCRPRPSNLLHRVITRVRHGHKIRGLTTLGVGNLLLQGPKVRHPRLRPGPGRVLWVGSGKGRDTIDRFFNDWLSRGQKARVAWASTWAPPHRGDHSHCPKVTLVIDRFHLVKALNQPGRGPQGTVASSTRGAGDQGLRWLLSAL